MKIFYSGWCIGSVIFCVFSLIALERISAIEPNRDELAGTQKWYNESFFPERSGQPNPAGTSGELAVLECPFQLYVDTTRYGSIILGTKKSEKGIVAHANSLLRVTLPSPGARFRASVGIVHNPDTSGGRGSVILSVIQDGRNGKELYRSPVKRGGEDGTPIDIDLAGTRSFLLAANDAGDGYSCDQACWADAEIVLQNGTVLLLSDLPVRHQTPVDYPFSFVYKGESSRHFLSYWQKKTTLKELDKNRTAFEFLFTSPMEPLQVICRGIFYKDFPTIEWTLHFKNNGKEKSPILENILSLDTACRGGTSYKLRHWIGGRYSADGFMLQEEEFNRTKRLTIKTSNGRGSDDAWPYFNIESKKIGIIAAVGWPGQWTSEFRYGSAGEFRFSAGQEDCRFSLNPGEEIRSPLSVVQFWKRDTWMDGQNIWRQWMLKYNVPRVKGQLETHHINGSSSPYYDTMAKADEACQKMFIDRYLEEKIPLDYWWMDAGWYPCQSWPETGTWEVDAKRFPKGLRAVTDYARSKGIKSIVWFEPEAAVKGSRLDREKPDWLLRKPDQNRLFLNWGNPGALQWTIDHFDHFIKREGIDFYRQDHNLPGLPFWRAADAQQTNRKGISEMKHVTGYLKFWDELLRRNPELRIDSCASGGRRDDLETMRRAVPLLRTDWILETTTSQVQTQGITFWIPLYGVTLIKVDDYSFRSIFTPYLHFSTDLRNRSLDYDSMRKNIAIWQKYFVPLYTKDFYTLTTPSLQNDLWAAWQFNDSEAGKGAIQVFRRSGSPYIETMLKLYGLDSKGRYRVKNVDTGKDSIHSGRELLSEGLTIRLEKKETAAIIVYEKI